MGDMMFFTRDANGTLQCLPLDTPDDLIASTEGATMKLDNQKNGWKGVCVYQETNGDIFSARYEHLAGDICTCATMGQRRKPSSWRIIMTGSGST